MKAQILESVLLVPILSVSLLLVGGCGAKEEAAPPPPAEPSNTSQAAGADAQKLATSVQQSADQAAAALKDQAAAAQKAAGQALKDVTGTADSAKAQGLIDTAKQLVSQNKYSDALKTLNDLSNLKLTPEQQKLVDNLKAQVQKQIEAMAAKKATDEASKAVGGLLKPKN
jgi:hypothetical protein